MIFFAEPTSSSLENPLSIDRAKVFGESQGSIERIAPGFFSEDPALEDAHVERYVWAGAWARAANVLDVACGTGYGADILKKSLPRQVISVDSSVEALTFGRQHYSLLAVAADAHCLPFNSASFDLVTCFETIEHLVTPKMFLTEVHRVIAPGGVLLLSTPNAARSWGSNPYHLKEFSLRELGDLLATCGFRILATCGQRWRPNGWLFERVKGFRRLASEIENIRPSKVRQVSTKIASPLTWCLVVSPVGRAKELL